MTSLKTTVGGALQALGTSLMGIGLIPQIADGPSEWLMYVSLAGFVLNAIGGFFAHLFAVEKQEVKEMIKKSENDTKIMINGGGSK